MKGASSFPLALLRLARLIVSSSAFGESFSNAIAEGTATGLPTVATDVLGSIKAQPRQP